MTMDPDSWVSGIGCLNVLSHSYKDGAEKGQKNRSFMEEVLATRANKSCGAVDTTRGA